MDRKSLESVVSIKVSMRNALKQKAAFAVIP